MTTEWCFNLLEETHIMQLVVEATRVTDGFAVVVSPPESRVGGAAVGAGHSDTTVAVSRLYENVIIDFNILQSCKNYTKDVII